LFKRVYELPEPILRDFAHVAPRAARFERTPVILAAASEGWLADRIARFGPAPCGFLFGTDDARAAARRLGLEAPAPLFDLSVSWFDATRVGDMLLGVAGSRCR
jgi:hypothetical protein